MMVAAHASATGDSAAVRIRTFERKDAKVVVDLFRDGTLSTYCRNGENEYMRAYVERSLQHDLANVEAAYMGSGGHFWVATMLDSDRRSERVVGCLGLEVKDNRGKLRRLSVHTECRRRGIAQLLVERAEQWSSEQGLDAVVLGTFGDMMPAIKLYERLGYTHTKDEPFAFDPNVTVVFFEKKLHMTSMVSRAGDNNDPGIEIRTFTNEDAKVVRDLFVDGMLSTYCRHGQNAYMHDYAQRSLARDLADIHGEYLASGGHFWVATTRSDDGLSPQVVGCLGLQVSENRGHLRRLSVHTGYRRRGIAQLLVEHAEQWALTRGLDAVALDTFVEMVPAIELYKAMGYTQTKVEPFSWYANVELVYFEKELGKA